MPTVLVIDRDSAGRAFCRAALEPHRINVVEAASLYEAIRAIRIAHPDLIVLDVLPAGSSGWRLAAELLDEPAAGEVPMVLMAMPAKLGTAELLDRGLAGRYGWPGDAGALASAVLDRLGDGEPSGSQSLPAETVLV